MGRNNYPSCKYIPLKTSKNRTTLQMHKKLISTAFIQFTLFTILLIGFVITISA